MGAPKADVFDSLLRKLERFGPLAAEDRAAVQRWPATERRVERGRGVERDGGSPQHCTLLVSGLVGRTRTTAEGKQQTLSFHFPGDFIDLHRFFDRPDDAEAVAISPARLAQIPIQAMRATAAERPFIARALTTDMLVEAAIGREWLLNVGQRNAAARLAHLLCECAVRLSATGYGEPASFAFPFRQSDLASATGLTSVHVNRTLRLLQEQGLIAYGAQHVTIIDHERLKTAGDFSPSYLKETSPAT